jgi:hypothetical protein
MSAASMRSKLFLRVQLNERRSRSHRKEDNCHTNCDLPRCTNSIHFGLSSPKRHIAPCRFPQAIDAKPDTDRPARFG